MTRDDQTPLGQLTDSSPATNILACVLFLTWYTWYNLVASIYTYYFGYVTYLFGYFTYHFLHTSTKLYSRITFAPDFTESSIKRHCEALISSFSTMQK